MRRRLLVAVVVLVVLVAAVVVATRGDDDVDTTVARSTADGPIELGDPPRSYRITMTVELLTTGTFEREVIEGRPPFDVRTERTSDGDVLSLDIATFGAIDVGPPEQQRAALVAEPGVPSQAPVVSGDLEALLDAGLAVDLEQAGTVADRPCRFLRTGTEDDHTDRCVDDRSLVLHEEWVVGGEVQRRRTATKVELDVKIGDDAFAPIGDRLDGSLGGGAVRRMTDESRFPDVVSYELRDVPDGLRHLGRFVIANDRPIDAERGPQPQTVGLADVYVGGTSLLVVENLGSTTAGVDALSPEDGEPIDVQGFDGDVRLILSLGQSELRTVDDQTGRAFRIVGTGPADELVALFGAVVELDGPAEAEPYDDVEDVLDERA